MFLPIKTIIKNWSYPLSVEGQIEVSTWDLPKLSPKSLKLGNVLFNQ